MFYNIVDDKLADEIKGKFFIAGGAIYSIHNNQEPKDIDIFLTDEKIKRKVLSHFHLNSSLKYKKGVKVGTYLDGDESSDNR